MMLAYSVSPIYDASKHSPLTDDYFYGNDDYQLQIDADMFYEQTDVAWKNEEQMKEYVDKILTGKEISDYEQDHAKRLPEEERQYEEERAAFLAEHIDRIRSEVHRKQINDSTLYRTEDRVKAAYENFKNVARKPNDNSEEQPEKFSPAPKQAVFIGRVTPGKKR